MGTGIVEAALFFDLSINFFVMIWLEFYYLVGGRVEKSKAEFERPKPPLYLKTQEFVANI